MDTPRHQFILSPSRYCTVGETHRNLLHSECSTFHTWECYECRNICTFRRHVNVSPLLFKFDQKNAFDWNGGFMCNFKANNILIRPLWYSWDLCGKTNRSHVSASQILHGIFDFLLTSRDPKNASGQVIHNARVGFAILVSQLFSYVSTSPIYSLNVQCLWECQECRTRLLLRLTMTDTPAKWWAPE